MVSRFFLSDSTLNDDNDDDSSIILLTGPTSSGKTSLLFQFAFNNNNKSSSSSVVFICSRRKLHANPPFLSKGLDPSDNAFHRIHIKYVEDGQGINKFFAAFHLHHTFPSLVIIDDFGDFFVDQQQGPRGRAILTTLALCRNAINHAKRWVNSIYTIKGDGIGSFMISANGLDKARTKVVKYSVSLQYLVLEDMYENGEQRNII